MESDQSRFIFRLEEFSTGDKLALGDSDGVRPRQESIPRFNQ
jgi:hypothetical protein